MKIHDYSGKNRRFGHDYTFTPITPDGIKGRIVGWGKGISKGDILTLDNGKETTQYKITKIEYYQDPPDMWAANAVFHPRREEVTT